MSLERQVSPIPVQIVFNKNILQLSLISPDPSGSFPLPRERPMSPL